MDSLPAILILAAGSSARMRGTDKLLESVDGVAQLTRITAAAVATGARVLVALPADHRERARAIRGQPVTLVPVADAASGMSASIRAGVAAARNATGLMILPADMPELETADLTLLIKAFTRAPNRIWRASAADGRLGHPVIFPASLFDQLEGLTGDTGARRIIAAHQELLSLLALEGVRALTDLDTPEDWAAWRAARQDPS